MAFYQASHAFPRGKGHGPPHHFYAAVLKPVPGRIKEFCGRIIVLSHFKKPEKAGFFLVELVCAVINARDNAPDDPVAANGEKSLRVSMLEK